MCGVMTGRYLKQVQSADEECNTQATLERLLGPKIHLAMLLNKLLVLESTVYD